MNQVLLYVLPVVSLVFIAISYVIKQARTKSHLVDTSQRLFSLLSISKDAMMLLDSDNVIQYMDEAMAELLQVSDTKKLLSESDLPHIHYKGTLRRFKDFIEEGIRPHSR